MLEIEDFYRITIYRLIELLRYASSKYTRSKVRKFLPEDFRYIIEELLHPDSTSPHKDEYYKSIVDTIISIDRAKEFIIAISKVIQKLVVDRLHIVGDIYDRGPRPDIVLDTLMDYHSVDIQWGNHDILWMDAACVYVNAPTSFTDGAQFGLGAEIGISTQKLGPRGPMGLEEITTYKWLIEGEGLIDRIKQNKIYKLFKRV